MPKTSHDLNKILRGLLCHKSRDKTFRIDTVYVRTDAGVSGGVYTRENIDRIDLSRTKIVTITLASKEHGTLCKLSTRGYKWHIYADGAVLLKVKILNIVNEIESTPVVEKKLVGGRFSFIAGMETEDKSLPVSKEIIEVFCPSSFTCVLRQICIHGDKHNHSDKCLSSKLTTCPDCEKCRTTGRTDASSFDRTEE